MDTNYKLKLKNKIEKLSKIHQLKVLETIIKNDIKYSENRNGIFLNMVNLNDKTIKDIESVLEYIQKQEKTLKDVEHVKNELNKDYFSNSNKETPTYLSNEH